MNDTEHSDNDNASPHTTPPPVRIPDVQGEGAAPFAYASTTEDSSPFEQPYVAELVPSFQPPARVWPALLVGILALPASAIIAGTVLGVTAMALYGPGALQSQDWIAGLYQTRFGLIVLIVPAQLVFLAASLGAAALSPETIRQRLALRSGRLPYWTWAVFGLATPIVGLGSSLLLSQVVSEPSEQLRLLSDMMQTHAQGGFVVGLLLLVGIVPGVVEELLFRGYLQSRLLRRWPPVAAIAVSALVFAAAHMDPIHVLGVLPLGIWLGVVAWKADSVWPAMLCHAVNNAVAVAGTVYGDPEVIEVTFDPVSVAALAIGGPAMLLSLSIFAKRSWSMGRVES